MNEKEKQTFSFPFQLLIGALLFFVLIYHFFTNSYVILKLLFLLGLIANIIGTVQLIREYKKRGYKNN